MRIGILGYGKMGKAVERQSVKRGHTPLLLDTRAKSRPDVDCVIDFTHADIAPDLIRHFLDLHIPVVSGTTGWNDQLPDVEQHCRGISGAFCWSPNFSVGMHIVFHLNKILAGIMDQQAAFSPEILEVHHTAKVDRPSGTAIALAEQILERIDRVGQWSLEQTVDNARLRIDSERTEDVKGIHRVTYKGPHEAISIRHHALSRDGFAEGAVLAAEWLIKKSGCFRFEDVLHFKGRS